MLKTLVSYMAGDQSEDLIPVTFAFNVPIPFVVCVLFLIAAGVAVGMYYWRRLHKLSPIVRGLLVAMRVIVVVLVLGLILDPSIVAKHVRPGEQIVALLFDDSASMRIGAENGASRGNRLVDGYLAAQEEFEEVLKRKHQIVKYRLGTTIEPIQQVDALTFEKPESNILDGVAQTISDLEGTTVSGIVVFSDGVQQSDATRTALADLTTKVPVFTVGVDSGSGWSDIELSQLSVKRTEFDKSPVVVTAGVHSQGLRGHTAVVATKVAGRTVQQKTIRITEDEQSFQVRMEYVPDRNNWIEYSVEVRLDEGDADPEAIRQLDRIEENNARNFVVDNRDKTYRVLYVSGRPNWEYKFISRALKEDPHFSLSGLVYISTAEPKFEFKGRDSSLSNPLFEGIDLDEDKPRYDEAVFLRLGDTKADELTSGFPTTPEEMYGYDLVIFGDIEREYLSTAQLELTRDFVEKRGGSFLMLGGPRAFTQGGYTGSPIENMLPVVLYQKYDADSAMSGKDTFQVEPTVDGTLAGVWTFDFDDNTNALQWEEMPPLYGMSYFPVVRAGATVLAQGRSADSDAMSPLFALQRYGEGTAGLLATGETWQWQMRLESEDDRHERLWRQITRYLVAQALQKTHLRDKADIYTQLNPASFDFLVRNEQYDKQEALESTVVVTSPSGKVENVPVDESLMEVGLYSSVYTPEESGLHSVTLLAMDENDTIVGRLEETFLAEADRREFQMAQFNPGFLDSVSEATGGARYALDDLARLAADIPLPLHQDADEIVLHLWHLPLFYWIIILLLPTEWYMRRKRGQA